MTWLLGEERSWIWCVTRELAEAYPLEGRRDVEQAARQLYSLWSQPTGGSRRIRDGGEPPDSRGVGADARRQAQRRGRGRWAPASHTRGRLVRCGCDRGREAPRRHSRCVLSAVVESLAHRPRRRQEHARANDGSCSSAIPSSWVSRRPVARCRPRVLRLRDRPAPYPRLPGSRREIAAIAGLASGWQTDVLLGERATKAAVLAEPLDRLRVLHFATHARLDVRDPQLSAVVLSGPWATGASNESALSLREIVGMDLNADAVVLSACEGSLGKDYRGQLSLGLSEAFLLAGSRNVVGSLWRVSDAATERYMRAFYRNITSVEGFRRPGPPKPRRAR